MRIRYFTDTDTLWIEFRDRPVAETRDLDEDTILDVDANGTFAPSPLGTLLSEPPFLSSRTNKSRPNRPL